jgi:hypothetical protein
VRRSGSHAGLDGERTRGQPVPRTHEGACAMNALRLQAARGLGRRTAGLPRLWSWAVCFAALGCASCTIGVALAIFRWHLLSPPLGYIVPAYDAPYSLWTIEHVFDSAAACDAAMTAAREHAQKSLTRSLTPGMKESKSRQLQPLLAQESCVCIAADDPRLKPDSATPSPKP